MATNNYVGWEEWVGLPELNLPALIAKTDTGADTSALHAFNIQTFGKKNNQMVRFGINPIDTDERFAIFCSAKIIDQRNVTSSNGITELRYVIETDMVIGAVTKKIPITLTNRENMKYKMIIGRNALDGFQVSPDKSFLQRILSYDLYKYKKVKKNSHRRSLRIGILSLEPTNYSNLKIIEAAEENGHFCEILNTKRCYLNIESDKPEVHYDGKVLPHYDAIIPRIGPSITKYGMAVVRQFEAMGTFCLNSSTSIGTSRDKLAAHQALAFNRIPMPDTAFSNSPRDTENIIDLTAGAPLVVKLLESSQGKGVILAETKKAASSVISAFQKLNAPFIVQNFVKDSNGCDLRLFVIGGKVIASMMRSASDDDFRSNLHAGGKASKVKITQNERKIAKQATKAMGLNIAGVDILRSSEGPKVLEVNSSPGLQGIETVNNINVASMIIDYLEKRLGLSKI
jgi:ribosomal protein S6--L-glutamate ligase